MRIISVLPPLPFPRPRTSAEVSANRLERARQLQHELNALARINAEWVLSEWDAGRTPKCCAKCNGTAYKPDDQGVEIELISSPELFRRGVGSCGSIAACHTGHKIAEAYSGRWFDGKRTEPISWDEACARYIVELADGPDPAKPMLFHAVCDDNGKRVDPTASMKRAS